MGKQVFVCAASVYKNNDDAFVPELEKESNFLIPTSSLQASSSYTTDTQKSSLTQLSVQLQVL